PAAPRVVGFAALVHARPQQPPAAEPKAPAKLPASPDPEAALALDQKLMATANDGSEVMKNLTHLSDVIGPRLTGSDNLRRANEWAAAVMTSYGLTNVRLEPWTIPIAWERGTASARIVDPDNGRTLDVASSAWSPGT